METRKLVRYENNGKIYWGLANGDTVSPLTHQYESTGRLLAGLADGFATQEHGELRMSDVRLLSPITPNQQFICQGLNYRQHLLESGVDPDSLSFNTIFTKAGSSLTGARETVVKPAHVKLLDYEAEIGFVISREITAAKQVTEATWHEYIAGLVLSNDLSARDIQLPQVQFYKGKSYRGFAPTGPWIALTDAESLRSFSELRLTLKVNNQTRQDFSAGDMLFKPWQTLTELSALQDLHPGDLVITGTSGGVAVRPPGKLVMFVARHFISEQKRWKIFVEKGLSNPLYLSAGDVIELSAQTPDRLIDLGRQETRIVAESN
jgi:2,4-didehydro-3-deoxy-L-rhamnonate hydrolase